MIQIWFCAWVIDYIYHYFSHIEILTDRINNTQNDGNSTHTWFTVRQLPLTPFFFWKHGESFQTHWFPSSHNIWFAWLIGLELKGSKTSKCILGELHVLFEGHSPRPPCLQLWQLVWTWGYKPLQDLCPNWWICESVAKLEELSYLSRLLWIVFECLGLEIQGSCIIKIQGCGLGNRLSLTVAVTRSTRSWFLDHLFIS